MKQFCLVAISFVVLVAIAVQAAPAQRGTETPAFPGTLATARSVYVASFDGDQFKPNLLLEDVTAIGAVQNAIRTWGKLMIVNRPSDADIIILVSSRPSEDVMAVYDAHGWPRGSFLWRVMGRGGLQPGETPLVTQFENAFESAQKKQ